ncbi:MAG: 50S ribosomal protein L11 methyltransferase [Firmicutes bacterium]|nr:50S ribosomal protein L11 methyltransferase [Bacillota bacterium]
MAWLEITVRTAGRDAQAVSAALTAAGFSDLVVEDEQELEAFLDENRACWDYIDESLQKKLRGLSQIRLYLEQDDTASATRLRVVLDRLGLQMEAVPLDETDWSESWKANYPPVEVGAGLVVLPCWLAREDCGERTPIILDPGLTFGTGAHPSTQMAMEFLEALAFPGFRCLDLGSGSGILSITALRLGASAALGVDIDPKAEDMARENAAYNGFSSPAFTACTGDVTADRALMARLSEQAWDVVMVNIVADVILALAPVLPRFLHPGSVLMCSGILGSRLEDVRAGLRQAGLTITAVKEKEDWRSLTAKRS